MSKLKSLNFLIKFSKEKKMSGKKRNQDALRIWVMEKDLTSMQPQEGSFLKQTKEQGQNI